MVDGLAVCWESPIGYYLKFCSSCQSKKTSVKFFNQIHYLGTLSWFVNLCR